MHSKQFHHGQMIKKSVMLTCYRASTESIFQLSGGIDALRSIKHGGTNEIALEIQQRCSDAGEAELDIKHRIANRLETVCMK